MPSSTPHRPAALFFSIAILAGNAARADEARETLGIAVLDLEATQSIAPALAETLTTLVAQHLTDTGAFHVTSQADVRRLIGFEKMKTALTCDLDASCLVDIGQTLGVPLLLAGKLSKLDDRYLLSLTLTDVEKPAVLGRELTESASEIALADASARAIARLVGPVLEAHAGRIVLVDAPEDLEVFIDGALSGRTPLKDVRATPGTHRVEVKREGWRTFARDVVVPVDKTRVVRVVMVPLPETHAALVRAALVQTSVAASLATASVVVGALVGGAGFALGEWFKSNLAHPIEGDPTGRAIVAAETAPSILIARSVGTAGIVIGALVAVPLVVVALSADWPPPLEEGSGAEP